MKLLVCLVVSGLCNKLFTIFQSQPMHNYPVILSLWTQFMYSVICCFYIFPTMYSGEIGTTEYHVSKRHFAIMGVLDGLASISAQFAVNYIYKSSLIPLLQQASLPLSMIASKLIVTDREPFHKWNYVGSFIVFIGLLIVLIPGLIFDRGNSELNSDSKTPIFWCIILVLSCIPAVFSSAYKEDFMNKNRTVNVMYINYWISIFQFIFVLPTIFMTSLFGNGSIVGGVKCLFGIDTITVSDNSTIISVDVDNCRSSLWFVNLFIFFNFIYNIYLILVLKNENNSLLWLALTLVVPLSQIILWIPGVPRHSRFSLFDLMGLFVILAGMLIYYFKKPGNYIMVHNSITGNFLLGEYD